ncbi:MAG: DNA repair protein RadC [Gammaproteobacteria bacterium]|nr:DNA repair protein RadC [Gammaproteobacteria bacterium]
MAIRHWPIGERPREKLLMRGAKHLSDAELLAIFLQTGTRGKTALDLARDLLTEFGSLRKLLSATKDELFKTSGLGNAKYAALKAILELTLRHDAEQFTQGEILKGSVEAKLFLAQRLRSHTQEVFAVLFLDTKHRMICFEELFYGTINEAMVYPREVVKRSLSHNAAKIILAHNHPSGDPTPSQADRDITKLLKGALALVDIQLIDHIIIGHRHHVSLAETGDI